MVTVSEKSVVRTEELSRDYVVRDAVGRKSKAVPALSRVTLEVSSGEVFGVIGPNGAGKTTLVKILSTLLLPTAGRASVLGFDVVRETHEVRKRIGVVFGGERGLYNRITGLQNLSYFSDLYGVPRRVARARLPGLLARVGLLGRENDKVETYSRGMKQRLHLAKALVNDPSLIFLDEPTMGLDPSGARDVRSLIQDLKRDGRSLLLTTHYMYEADELCDRIAVISKGRVVIVDRPSGLKRLVKDVTAIEFEVYGRLEHAELRIRSLPEVSSVTIGLDDEKQLIRVQSSSGAEMLQTVRTILESEGVRILQSRIREPTLEDAYFRLVAG